MAAFVDVEQTQVKPQQLDVRNGCCVRDDVQLLQRVGSSMKENICCQPAGKSLVLVVTCLPSTCLQTSNVLITVP